VSRLTRRRILRLTTQSAALAGTISLGLQQRAVAIPMPVDAVVPPAAPSGPVRQVRGILPGASKNAIALTIDDGPHPLWTPQILDLLHNFGVRATFSLIGTQARARPALVKRIIAEGHGICNHSMTHPQRFGEGTADAIDSQIADAQDVIDDVGGQAPKLFRAPGGNWSDEVLSAVSSHQMVPLGWNIDPRDWSRPGVATITSRLLAAQGGDILLCHDGGGDREQTIRSLRFALPALKRRGLRFVKL
jgi:peptidoglycan/xylan/chitin deacetylase (PgdA/CDA1 family)